ncbi:MAG: hypothetical protein ABR908_11755 [Terriglobales bacterium]|jgi:Holliday junction resolvasome RuvABC ATP-dependent DNA helicase subunit
MEKNFDSEPAENVTREDLASVMTALEPDQIIFAKEHHHCPRRQLTRTEMILFWALRIYLVFMVGVVVYQIWTGVR